MKRNYPLYRHGDVIVEKVNALRRFEAKRTKQKLAAGGVTLAYGEKTGHAHRVVLDEADATIRTWMAGNRMLFELPGPATLRHEEHGPIRLDPGLYEAWIQREYVPGGAPGEVRFVPVQD